MEDPFTAQMLLPDLPNDEPWFELKFHLQELHGDSRDTLQKLQELKPLLGIRGESHQLHEELFTLYGAVHHHAKDHARRAMELAGHLLTRTPESVPEWKPGAEGTANFDIPSEVSACTSLEDSRTQLAFHMNALFASVDRAHHSVLRAAGARGSMRQVLEAVHAEASAAFASLHDDALPHARDAYCWSEQHWRLADPEAAAAHDQRSAEIDAELAALEKE
ncbi:hypothetical protein [Hyalangium rubrum]|uniref:Hemerythrin-like domain-containing protein n=1 Tax=Hyalangium rubrum TaxID=3103134 RepID=A0ABU5GZA7_9BACT|nr:hypothetical protein [Hyalangium sp. s54d21]MDY7226034.1 hypothetical protein [Hyalangium sp. s54d21]